MTDDRMFGQLMETQAEKPKDPIPAPSPKQPAKPKDELRLPEAFEDIGRGYTAHSYRLTDAEVTWLRRFCLKLSEEMDRTVTQNELIRSLFRLADQEWRRKPEGNRILDELSRHDS
jgi:hypothetical protein